MSPSSDKTLRADASGLVTPATLGAIALVSPLYFLIGVRRPDSRLCPRWLSNTWRRFKSLLAV